MLIPRSDSQVTCMVTWEPVRRVLAKHLPGSIPITCHEPCRGMAGHPPFGTGSGASSYVRPANPFEDSLSRDSARQSGLSKLAAWSHSGGQMRSVPPLSTTTLQPWSCMTARDMAAGDWCRGCWLSTSLPLTTGIEARCLSRMYSRRRGAATRL